MQRLNRLNQTLCTLVGASTLLLAGCGGSSGGDTSDPDISALGSGSLRVKSPVVTTQAEVTVENSTELAETAARGIKKVVLDDINQQKVPFSQSTASGLALAYCDPGSADLVQSADKSELQQVLTMKACVIDGNTLDGDVLITSSADFNSLNFYFFTTTVKSENGDIYELTGSDITCDARKVDATSCTYAADWTENGEAYRVEDALLSGNLTRGFRVSGKVYDTQNGYVEVQTSRDLTFNCPQSNPGSGALSFSGAGGSSGSVSFDSCIGFTVIVDGVAKTVNWADL
jgi:hypothetical protein